MVNNGKIVWMQQNLGSAFEDAAEQIRQLKEEVESEREALDDGLSDTMTYSAFAQCAVELEGTEIDACAEALGRAIGEADALGHALSMHTIAYPVIVRHRGRYPSRNDRLFNATSLIQAALEALEGAAFDAEKNSKLSGGKGALTARRIREAMTKTEDALGTCTTICFPDDARAIA